MSEELSVLIEVAEKLESAGASYMLTGSLAMAFHAIPRMTRDIDLVVAVNESLLTQLPLIFPEDQYYLSPEAARQAVTGFSSFNLIHLATMIKIDFMVRKPDSYRLHEFSRREARIIAGHSIFIVTKEDLILSKLAWARDSESERQLSDVKNLLSTPHDQSYLIEWATKLQLIDILTRVSA